MEKYKEISREELKKWIDEKEKFVLIDVLPHGSYEGRHLPGAKHADVNKPDFLEKVESFVPDKNTKCSRILHKLQLPIIPSGSR